MIGEDRFTRAPDADRACCARLCTNAKSRATAVELSFKAAVLVAVENRRGGDNGSRSFAVADRNSDPDHSFDLALRRPARLKRALINSQRAGGPGTAGSALCLNPQAIAGSLKSIESVGALKARARIADHP